MSYRKVRQLVTLLPIVIAMHAEAQEVYRVINTFPTGKGPVSVASYLTDRSLTFVASSNAGENTVSLYLLEQAANGPGYILSAPSLPPLLPKYSVHSPFGVHPCRGFLITSTAGTTVTYLRFSVPFIGPVENYEFREIVVGPQPLSAACRSGDGMAVISTLGDNALSLVDLLTGAIRFRMTGVPASRGLHGIAIDQNGNVWVAGTDSNVVTVVNLSRQAVVASFPVRLPIAIGISQTTAYIATEDSGTFTPVDIGTLQFGGAFSIRSAIQDFVPFLASGGNSVTRFSSAGAISAVLRGIPEAAGIDPSQLIRPNVRDGRFIASRGADSLYLLGSVPFPASFGISNAASFSTNIGNASGSLASLFTETRISQSLSAVSLPLPEALGGASVRVGGTLDYVPNVGWTYSPTNSSLAKLLFAGPSQVNFQISPGVPPGDAVPVQLTRADGSTLLSTVRIVASAPGIFSVLQNGQGQGAVLNENSTQNFGTNPARRGSVVQIFATGAGETTPPLLAGEPAPASGNPLVLTNVQPVVTIAGQAARVLFSGMAPGFVGLWQINAEVPATVTPGTAVPLTIAAGGVTSNTVTIAVE